MDSNTADLRQVDNQPSLTPRLAESEESTGANMRKLDAPTRPDRGADAEHGFVARTRDSETFGARAMSARDMLALVRRQMGAIARGSQDLDDLVQTALFELERTTFRGDSQFSTFSHSICYRVWQKHCKRMSALRQKFCELRDIDEGPAASDESPQDSLESKQEREHLHGLVARLSKTQRDALSLYYFEGLDAEQISLLCATRTSTIHTRLRDGKAALGRML